MTNTEIRLKNTLEVALVLDNSGSMDNYGTGSGQKRIDLLKAAAKQLVDTLAEQAAQIKQVDKPVQFSLVPFAASVNVGPDNAGASWMDVEGLSPVHQENFDWSTLDAADKRAEKIGGIWYKKGTGWGEEENRCLSRFSLYRDMKQCQLRANGSAPARNTSARDTATTAPAAAGQWQETGYYDETISAVSRAGRAASRPGPIPTTPTTRRRRAARTTPASASAIRRRCSCRCSRPTSPATAGTTEDPDEPSPTPTAPPTTGGTTAPRTASGSTRQQNMTKYFDVRARSARPSPQGSGPNYSCTTEPITPLTDVTVPEGLAAIKAAIDRMAAERQHQRAGGHGLGLAHRVEHRAVHRGAAGSRKGQRQGRHRAHRRRQHLFAFRTAIRPATSRPTRPMAICSPATTAPARPAVHRHQRRSASSTIRAATTPPRSTSRWRRCATTQRRRTSW